MTVERKAVKKPKPLAVDSERLVTMSNSKDGRGLDARQRERELTPKQVMFCRHLLSNGFNKAKAARDAGYAGQEVGYVLYKKPHVRSYIDRLKLEQTISPAGIIHDETGDITTTRRLLQEFVNLGLADITRVCRWGKDYMAVFPSESLPPEISAAIKKVNFEEVEFTGKTPKIVRKVSVEMHEKKGALDSAARVMGMFDQEGKQDPVEIADKLRGILETANAGLSLPRMPDPNLDHTLRIVPDEEDQTPISDQVKH